MAIPTPDAPFRAALAAGLAIASGLKNVQSIIDVQTPGGGGAGGSAPAAEAPRAPTFNIVGTSPASANQIANTIGKEQPPVKAYVVSNDVTTAQSLERNIVSSASLG
jgi:threonine dehydratase